MSSDEALSAAAASAEKERATREQYAEVAANAAALQTQVKTVSLSMGKQKGVGRYVGQITLLVFVLFKLLS